MIITNGRIVKGLFLCLVFLFSCDDTDQPDPVKTLEDENPVSILTLTLKDNSDNEIILVSKDQGNTVPQEGTVIPNTVYNGELTLKSGTSESPWI